MYDVQNAICLWFLWRNETNIDNKNGRKRRKQQLMSYLFFTVIKYATNQNIRRCFDPCANGSVVIVMSMVTVYLWSCRAVCIMYRCVQCSRCYIFFSSLSPSSLHFTFYLVCFLLSAGMFQMSCVSLSNLLCCRTKTVHCMVVFHHVTIEFVRKAILVSLFPLVLCCGSRSLPSLTTIFFSTQTVNVTQR